ncbi:MAG TPA: HEXXH motif-containing putative peptide modification protein [Bacteriovoracaceae bacterium]|nr:HEXXH motif-containing putative peptide modification protein [Bacteriovoracaceae bacterium]
MIFYTSTYSRLNSRLHRKYLANLKAILKAIKSIPPDEITYWVKTNKAYLAGYSAVKWNFLKQFESYIDIARTIPKLSVIPTDFSKHDDEAFERWSQSEFSDVFLKTLNQGKSIKVATDAALKQFEQHLLTFGNRQILRADKTHPAYRIQTSLGEYKKAKKVLRLLETTMHLEGKELNLMTSSLKEMMSFSQKIEIALKVIKKFSPTSWDRFKVFTEVIIPIKQSEFVSYSHQDLPGYSMINLFDRDFVDIMDDLLHENGHHHLNYYLNLGKVIEEPQDCIYYSPWRRTLRPLRGIFHAHFTFFWAFELFASLASAKELDSIFYVFGPKEKEKIYWRAVEEYWMLEYSYHDLHWANRHGLISDVGWKLIQEQRKHLVKYKKKVSGWEKHLKAHKIQLKELKSTLKSAKKKYQK